MKSRWVRIAAAAGTFVAGSTVVAALTLSAPADAKPNPDGFEHMTIESVELLAKLEANQPNLPDLPKAEVKTAPKKPDSTAKKFLPVRRYGGY